MSVGMSVPVPSEREIDRMPWSSWAASVGTRAKETIADLRRDLDAVKTDLAAMRNVRHAAIADLLRTLGATQLEISEHGTDHLSAAEWVRTQRTRAVAEARAESARLADALRLLNEGRRPAADEVAQVDADRLEIRAGAYRDLLHMLGVPQSEGSNISAEGTVVVARYVQGWCRDQQALTRGSVVKDIAERLGVTLTSPDGVDPAAWLADRLARQRAEAPILGEPITGADALRAIQVGADVLLPARVVRVDAADPTWPIRLEVAWPICGEPDVDDEVVWCWTGADVRLYLQPTGGQEPSQG